MSTEKRRQRFIATRFSGLRTQMRAAREGVTTSDAGMTLPEVLIGSILMAVVGSLCVGVVVNVSGGSGKTDNDLRGLQEMRTLQERLGRDLLQARGVTTGSTASQLSLWIDDNGDYLQTPNEVYRWELAPAAGGSGQEVRRVNVIMNGAQVVTRTVVVARSVVSTTAFKYRTQKPTGEFIDAIPPSVATVVDVDLTYNPGVGAQNKPRNLKFSIRMRNHA